MNLGYSYLENLVRKLFVSVDMEGCAGVSSIKALSPEGWEWPAARKWMTLEAAAVAEAALEGGYDEVVMTDGHGNALNLDPDLLPEKVRLVRSWPRPLVQMQGAEDPEVVACAFIGYHAEASTQDSVHAHTYSGVAIRGMRLNGELCSEGYFNAALAGELGLPVILVSGDAATVADMRRYAPEAVGFEAKQSISQRASASFPPARVRRELKSAMATAVSRPLTKKFIVPGPYRIELEMTTQAAAAMLSWLPGIERVSAWKIGASFKTIADAMRFLACAMLYTPNGVPALS